jgi:AraC family transcriptional regulator
MLRLSSGEYLGRNLRRTPLPDLPLTLTAYPPGHAYPWHVHEIPTLFVLLAGQHHDENRRASFDQSPLSVVFHPTQGPHATSVGPGGMVGINLELTDAWLDRCQVERRDLTVGYRLLDSLCAKLLGLRLAALVCGEASATEIETVALEMVACLVRDPSPPIPPGRAPRWLPRAQELLRSNLANPVGLRDVAAEVGVHPVYCARAFRRAVGCTVTEYLRALRLLEAGRLILGGKQGLAEIALSAGFADQAHFTRTCSRELGFTPGRLQRMRKQLFPEAAGSSRSRTGAP